jgi:DNA-binding Lrp family transcriptional regulator
MGKVIVFTYYEDTLEYLFENLKKSKEFSKFRIEKISGKTTINERLTILEDFSNKKIDILISTDVLSEGENLQVARVVVNYDLHWNPTRMIQRAGRIDRIGSPYDEIFIYNVFPEDELEDLLRLVETLQNKIREIDQSIGLDQQILGEKIHPKVFGVIRRIKAKDEKVFEDLEAEMFGGGEKFYQPLKDFINKKGLEELDNIPNGIHSGLKKNKSVKGIFFYYKYLDDFHFWYLYDINSEKIIKNKSEIIDFISCSPEEKRVIPEFFERIYEINEKILNEIEKDYKTIEQQQKVDTDIAQSIRNRAATFLRTLIREIEKKVEDYLDEYPGERDIEVLWDNTRNKLQNIVSSLTKRQLRDLRKMWIRYKRVDGDWKKLIKDVYNLIKDIYVIKGKELPPFDKEKLKLIVVDFVS